MQKETRNLFPATVFVLSLMHVVQLALAFTFFTACAHVYVTAVQHVRHKSQIGLSGLLQWSQVGAVSSTELSWYE